MFTKILFSDIKFAREATGVNSDLSKPKNIIDLFQKYTDLYKSNPFPSGRVTSNIISSGLLLFK